jgi:hypothetical protein
MTTKRAADLAEGDRVVLPARTSYGRAQRALVTYVSPLEDNQVAILGGLLYREGSAAYHRNDTRGNTVRVLEADTAVEVLP